MVSYDYRDAAELTLSTDVAKAKTETKLARESPTHPRVDQQILLTFSLLVCVCVICIIVRFVVIFGINTTGDISKLLYVKFETILIYHE